MTLSTSILYLTIGLLFVFIACLGCSWKLMCIPCLMNSVTLGLGTCTSQPPLRPGFCPNFAPKTLKKGKSGTSFLEHMLAISSAANLGKGKY